MPSYSKIFGDWLCETAAKDNKLMAITPAMREGSAWWSFRENTLTSISTWRLPSSTR
jgi:deoxyxylulose-5-phosphate synthase